jgi:sensor c-di-GMP phosphodiesterase-like protein
LQKEQLKQSQQTVESLKKEQAELKPVVEADRKIVESILSLQAQRAKANVWQERLIGFGLGVVGSLFASLIWSGIRRGRNA